MYHNDLIIKEGAVLIADAHYNKDRKLLLTLLKQIQQNHIKTSQIIFMGDIFDLLFGPIRYTRAINQEAIDIINHLSQTKELWYFEGNHDFVLKKVFPKVNVFSLEEQPVLAKIGDKTMLFSHGDVSSGFGYALYCKIIRNKPLLHFLQLIDSCLRDKIIKCLEQKLLMKKICTKFHGFENFLEKRVRLFSSFKAQYMVEGHFHQGGEFCIDGVQYMNVPSFACDKSFFVVQSIKTPLLRVEKLKEDL